MHDTDWLRTRARLTPDDTALLDDDRRCSFRELDAAAGRFAAALRSRAALREGDRVATLAGNSIDHAIALLAALRLGATVVPLNTRLAAPELARQAGVVSACLLLAEESRREAAAAAGIPVLGLEECRSAAPQEASAQEAAVPESPPQEASAQVRPQGTDQTPAAVMQDGFESRRERLVCILFSSGSSGVPKAVPLTESNLAASARASASHLATGAGDNWLCVLPLFHVGGFSILTRALIDGFAVTLAPRFEAAGARRLLREHGATLVSLVPVMLSRLLDDPGFTAREYPALRAILLGGAGAPQSLLREAALRGLPLLPTYGLTETSSQVVTAPYELRHELQRCAGRPLEGVRVEIRDAGGRALPASQSGEIWVSGPMVTEGYLDGDASAFRDGCFRTGDLGSIDAGGLLTVEGRRDDVIITGGENVSPAEVEQVLLLHPGVADAAVFGVPDAEWGQRVCACIVPAAAAAAAPPDATELDRFCRASLAGYKVPRRWRMLAEIPRNAAGKINRKELAERSGR